MTARRKWVMIPGMVAIALVATMLSAYAGSQSAETPAPAGAEETATQKANREAFGKAKPGPWAYSGASGYTNYLGGGIGYSPEQPVKFPHPVHVNALKMNCAFCHNAANQSPDPGLPAVATCMGCHTIVGGGRPEIVKLTEYWNNKQPVPWVRIHKVPEYVHFPHMRHVNAGVTCQTCHGQVNNMPQVFMAQSLNMGWCVQCHVNGYDPAEGVRAAGYEPDSATLALPKKKATYDCATCHY
ncbi:MAG: cytochrome c3 family protein [Gemmatimonadota bacterium]